MENLDLIQSFYTVVTGYLVYILGLITNESFVKPFVRYKGIKEKINQQLIQYSTHYTNPATEVYQYEDYKKLQLLFRETASEFASIYGSLGLKRLLIKFRRIVSNFDKDKVEGNLFFLSNNIYKPSNIQEAIDQNMKKSKEIRTILKLQ